MDRFSKYNPKATLLFFILIITATIVLYNPVLVAISFVSAFLYKLKIDSRSAVVYLLKYVLPLVLLATLFNFAFTHYGATTIFTINDTNFTLEGAFYGFNQGVMLGGVIMWFSSYSAVITTDRFLSVFGNTMPNLALLFAMVLSFIPRLKKNASEINDARAVLNNDDGRLKKSINNFSALITLTLEQSIETANSMKSRGFKQGRSVYSKYRISLKDYLLIFIETMLFVAIMIIKAMGLTQFIFEPEISLGTLSPSAIILTAVLSLLPIIIDFVEDMRWLYLKQKI